MALNGNSYVALGIWLLCALSLGWQCRSQILRGLSLLWIPTATAAAVAIGVLYSGIWSVFDQPRVPAALLLWPYVALLLWYSWWRLGGNRPLALLRWDHVGALSAITSILADLALAQLTPAKEGHSWYLGGAGWRDALALGPPFVAAMFWTLTDCRSPLVFCSRSCRDAHRCLHQTPVAPQSLPSSRSQAIWQPVKSWGTAVCCAVALAALLPVLVFRSSTPLSDPATLELQHFASELARKHAISPPVVQFVASSVPALTTTTCSDERCTPTIQLGRAGLPSSILNDPKLLQATVAHEFGHVLQDATGRKFPILLLAAYFGLPVLVLLRLWVAPRAVFLLAGAIALVMVLGATLSESPQVVFHYLLGAGGVAGACLSYARRSIRPALLVASAALLHFGLGLVVGDRNAEREHDADLTAACSVSRAAIAEVLTILGQGRVPTVAQTVLDPFHPTIPARLARLTAFDASACASQAGLAPLDSQ